MEVKSVSFLSEIQRYVHQLRAEEPKK